MTTLEQQALESRSAEPVERTERSHAANAYHAPLAVMYVVAGSVLCLSLAIGVLVGPVHITPVDVARVILTHVFGLDIKTAPATDAIIWRIRVPRVLLAGMVGATLAYSGAAYQGIFRNPLADPYLLGVAAGAGLAATIVIVAPVSVMVGLFALTTPAAFGGALLAVAITYGCARIDGHTPLITLILAGVAVSSLAVAGTSYLMLANQRDSIVILSWLLGGFNGSSWSRMLFIAPYAVPAAAVIFLHGRILNVLQLDDQQAMQLGVNVERTKLIVLVAASLAAAAAVAVAGIIGFVGLIVPHLVRLVAGPDYRRLLPLSAIAGAAFLILADVAARTAISPGELPVGVVTALLGVPVFLFLLRQQGHAYV